MGNKINFTSLGCSRNLVDTEVMLGIVLKAGYQPVSEPEDADFLVVNTCGFLKSAREEALDVLDELFEIKKKSAKVIVVGCMVQGHKKLIEECYPDVHYYLGSGDMGKILSALISEEQGDGVTDAKSFLQQGEVPRLLTTPNHFGYLKIAEGCKKRCAFCIIPLIKGKLKSKPIEQVKKEFRALINSGAREIILIAQDLGDYGKDQEGKPTLAVLLKELLKEEGDFWLRLLYLYPDEIDDELIELIKNNDRLLPYLDMPIQHINDQILKNMHRKTDRKQIINTITKLRKEIPHIVIRSSLMVGFPQETEEQFCELLAFVKEYKLDNIGIFQYSLEEDSYSAKLPGHISEEVKQDRFERLAAAQAQVAEDKNDQYIGKQLEVVVEAYHPESEHLMTGRFYGQAPDVDGEVIINDVSGVDTFGERYLVEITDAIGYDLIGQVIEPMKKRELQESRSPLALL
ncbi:MAG: 30S ribosomal protein S12 methylthiotransferase RimO [Rhabdochlamydiaceae bacterium]|nr:30S ribosomal protein S12 methylthiotransferase RimO [Candidatus Amphrikana amoebophyrae]